MMRAYEFSADDKTVAGFTEAEFQAYLSTKVRDGVISLEDCFQTHLFHDTVGSGESYVISGGEVQAPAGLWGPSFSSFLDWAVNEGLLTVTDKGQGLPWCSLPSEAPAA